MGDISTYIIILVIVLLVAYLINRSQSRGGMYRDDSQGDESPYYDDPDIRGQGSFGRDASDNDISESRPRSSFPSGPGPGSRRDSPNIRGRGSFGKDKR